MTNQATIQQIHDATMQVLNKTGIAFLNDTIIEKAKAYGLRTDGYRVFFTEEELMTLIGKAPDVFKLSARNPKYDMTVGGDHINFVSATCGFPYVCTPEGERPAVYDDFITFLKLNQQSPYYNVNGGVMVTPNDSKDVEIYPTMLLSTVLYSDKVIFGGIGGEYEALHTMNMLKILFGEKELQEASRAITIISSASPLQFDGKMLETMIHYVENGQAIIVAPAVMAGTSGPVTMAGTIVVSNAESLAGIAISQILKPGTPAIYGSATALSDLRNGSFCIGSAESALAIKYCTKLAKFYKLPCRGGGTLTDSRINNIQAGYEGMMCLMAAASNRMNFMLHSAGALGSYRSMSFEKYIVDLEITGMVKTYADDILVNEETLAVDVINEVGPAGEFLTHEHTLMNFRDSVFITDLAVRGTATAEESDAVYNANITTKMQNMLDSYVKPDLDQQIVKQLAAYLEKIGHEVRLV